MKLEALTMIIDEKRFVDQCPVYVIWLLYFVHHDRRNNDKNHYRSYEKQLV